MRRTFNWCFTKASGPPEALDVSSLLFGVGKLSLAGSTFIGFYPC